jgi:hypothetical protein
VKFNSHFFTHTSFKDLRTECQGKGFVDGRWFKALTQECQCGGRIAFRFSFEGDGFCSGINFVFSVDRVPCPSATDLSAIADPLRP